MMRRLLAVLLLSVCAGAATATDLPETARGSEQWQRWGSGEMSWLGFRLYRATLWVGAGGGALAETRHALTLHYLRAIDRERLVGTSIDEMRRLGADDAQLQRWQPQLQRVFPSVREGETITGVHLPGVGVRFYHDSRHVGDIDDADFARRFFGIWLDPRTRAADLRLALLRRPDGG